MNATPPGEFGIIGLHGKFDKAGANEWHGPCPRCGGQDRFVIFTDREYPSWNWFCRQCHPDPAWIDELNPRLKGIEHDITPAERAERAARMAFEAEQRLAAEIERAKLALQGLQEARAWLRYHDQLTEEARRRWDSWGIPEFWQDYWKLGYDPDRVIYAGNTEWHTPTMTIPIFEPGWNCVNVRHRLLKPPKPGDKYRPDRSGLPAAFFIADPDRPLEGKTLLVEGEKKAMVSYITADDPAMHVIGIPGKNPKDSMVAMLKDCDPVYICLDTDARQESRALANNIGKDRARIIELPGKIDDLIINHKLDRRWIMGTLRQAVKL